MKKLLTLVSLIAIVALAGTAFAQAEPGDAGIFFDAAGTMTSMSGMAASVPFMFHIVAFDPGEVFGYEFSLSNSLPAGMLFILAAMPDPVGSATNFGTTTNWIVGTGVCYGGAGAVKLGTVQALALIPPVDMLLCLGPYSPSSFTPAVPGYVSSCTDASQLTPFGVALNGQGRYPDGCAVGNPTQSPPVGNELNSWGSLKAQYND